MSKEAEEARLGCAAQMKLKSHSFRISFPWLIVDGTDFYTISSGEHSRLALRRKERNEGMESHEEGPERCVKVKSSAVRARVLWFSGATFKMYNIKVTRRRREEYLLYNWCLSMYECGRKCAKQVPL